MNSSSAALARTIVFFAQGVLFALVIAGIFGVYLPNVVFLSAGAALGLFGLIQVVLVARAGETGARRGFLMATGVSAAGITLGAILHNVFAAVGGVIIGMVFFGLALFVFPVLFIGGWCGSLVLLGSAGKPLSKQRKRAAGAVAVLSVLAMAGVLALRVDGEGYSVSSELAGVPAPAIERLLVTAEIDEALGPVFRHSFQHSLVSALETNGIEVIAGPSLGPGEFPADELEPAGPAPGAELSISVKPLYRTHPDGYEALVGTVFEATLVDAASGEEAWRLSGAVDYIADRFFRQHGFRAHEESIKEFAWHTTAAVVRTFMADVAGRESAPIYTGTEARVSHGQRID